MTVDDNINGNGVERGLAIDSKSPPLGLYLNNQFVQGDGEVVRLVNPKDGSEIPHQVKAATQPNIDQAVAHAREAFTKGPWSQWTGARRAKALLRWADLIEENAQAIAYLESIASGRPLSMLVDEIPRVANSIRYFAGWADKVKGYTFPPEDGFYKIVRKEPLGVCCGITAWNASMLFLAWKAGPALATGNTFILKPSEKSFLASLAIASLTEAAGIPPGVFQVLIGGGSVGASLSSHMDINKLSFTGSSATGIKIQEAATRSNLKRVTLELGGKSAAIVFEDADIDKSLFWVLLGITVNSGQVCSATSRLLVQESIAESFISKLKEKMAGMGQMLGMDPQDLNTVYGPLVDAMQHQKVMKYIEEGKKSTEMITGDVKIPENGYYVAPTIFLNPAADTKIWTEEIFGPVLCVKTFKHEEDAITIANDSQFGLSGAIFTQSLTRALRVSGQIESGTVCVNCNLMAGDQVPMGGKGLSGVGRELGEDGIAEYVETKTIWISMQ